MQGLNEGKTAGFLRPKLDPAETDRDDLIAAMKGHVLASGDLVVPYTGK